MFTHPQPQQQNHTGLQIAERLTTYLQETRINRLYYAENQTPPPQLAFLVHFPRLSVTLLGQDEMEIDLDGRPAFIASHQGEAVFVPPNCWNRPTWAQPMTALHFLFGQTQLGVSLVEHDGLSQEPSRARTLSTHRVIGRPTQAILDILIHLPAELRSSRVSHSLVEALLHSCLQLLEESPSGQPGRKARNTYERICLYLQANFYKPLTRESVAAQFRLNPNHLSRLFRQQGLMKFTDYLTWVRVDRAKFLLKHHEQGLNEIASSCGYADTSYFCRVFRQKTKLTPTEYRQKSSQGHDTRVSSLKTESTHGDS